MSRGVRSVDLGECDLEEGNIDDGFRARGEHDHDGGGGGSKGDLVETGDP
jgi:hypothetical protein